MEGTVTPPSLLLLLLLWTCCSLASAARGIDGVKDAGCEVLTDQMSDTEFVLDSHTLQSADGDVQRVLDCLPQGSKVLVDMEDVPLSKDLVVRKPMAIHSRRNGVRTTISGGFVKVRADNITIKGLTIEGYNMNSSEAFIDIESAEGVVIEEVECSGCSNSQGPSCISATSSSVTIRKFSGKNNSGTYGGAMGFTDSTIVIRDSLFKDNASSEDGGALHMDTCDLEMENTLFTGNRADGGGGGVYAKAKPMSYPMGGSRTSKSTFLRNCSFIENHARGRGGGLHYEASQTHKNGIEIVDTDVTDNFAAGYGGGMLIDMTGTTNPTVKVQSSRFISNSADKDGGGLNIWMRHSTNGIFQVINSNFNSNSASRGGGVDIYGYKCNNCTADVFGTQITENTATKLGGGAWFNYHTATNGHVDIYKSTVDYNTAPKGAGVYFEVRDSDATDVKLLLSSFTNHPDGGIYFNNAYASGFEKSVFECTIKGDSDNQSTANHFANVKRIPIHLSHF